jgi:Tfp pilus assembly protein PilF
MRVFTFRSFNVKDIYEARRLIEKSLALDPNYARSYALLADTYPTVWVNRLDGDYLNPAALDRALQLERKAVELDPHLPEAHAVLGFVFTWLAPARCICRRVREGHCAQSELCRLALRLDLD